MDVQMPELDGLEATRRIRSRMEGAQPRIVAVTANALSGERERYEAAGMDACISKPIRLEELVEALRATRPLSGVGTTARPEEPRENAVREHT
jgi:CheY-like chemotaxis protein